MHVCALVLELLHLERRIIELVAQVVNLLEIRPDGVVESLSQWVRRRCHVRRRRVRCRVTRSTGRSLRRAVRMVLRGRSTVGLQLVLGCGRARVLGVFVQATLVAVRVWGCADRHLQVLFAFGRSVARESAEKGHGEKNEKSASRKKGKLFYGAAELMGRMVCCCEVGKKAGFCFQWLVRKNAIGQCAHFGNQAGVARVAR